MILSRRTPVTLCAAVALSAASLVGALTAQTQAPPEAAAILNRMSSAYRSLRSYQDTAAIKRVNGKRESTASLTIAMQRPNHYVLDLKGDRIDTVVLSDGTSLIAQRPDRKVYTKTRAPQLLMGSDILTGVDLPTPSARIITQLLAGRAREGDVAKMLAGAKVTGPAPYKEKSAYVLAFRFNDELDAQVTVGSDDYLIREVKLLRGDTAVWTETHDDIQADKPVPATTFERPLPPGAILLVSLPPLDRVFEAAEADSETADDLSKAPERLQKAAMALYRSSGCGRCHDGGTGPDLSQEGADPEHTAKWIADHIKNPQTHTPGSSMPAFGTRLSARNIDILAAYLATRK